MGKSGKKSNVPAAGTNDGSLSAFLLGSGGGGATAPELNSKVCSLFDTSTKFERVVVPEPEPKRKREDEGTETKTKKGKVRPLRPLKSEKEGSSKEVLHVATAPLRPGDHEEKTKEKRDRSKEGVKKVKEGKKSKASLQSGSAAAAAGAASKEEKVTKAPHHQKKEKTKKKQKEPVEQEQEEGPSEDKTDQESSEEKDQDEEDLEQQALAEAVSGEKDERTVFVGNVPVATTKNQLINLFKQAGEIESVRLRSMALEGTKVDQHGNQALVKKISANKKLFATEVKDTCNAYVVFKSEASIPKALAFNNTVFNGKHLRMDHVGRDTSKDYQRSAFLGNLPFDVADEEVRQHFASLLEGGHDAIENVRIVREPETQVGKGFGFLLLKDKAVLAEVLRAGEQTIKGRKIRVTTCGRRMKAKGKGRAAPRPAFEGRRAVDSLGFKRNGKKGGGDVPGKLRLKKRGGTGGKDTSHAKKNKGAIKVRKATGMKKGRK